MSRPSTFCAICNNLCDHAVKSYLTCSICLNDIHLSCLQEGSAPMLKGDVFLKLSCKNCSPSQKEVVVREKVPWLNIILVAVYNLHKTSSGLSNRGYFHWKMHISDFIARNWKVLLGSTVRKKKSWLGTVSGTLSHYSPIIFISGTPELKDVGWWKLARILKPKIILDEYHGTVRKKLAVKNQVLESSPPCSEDLAFDETSRSSAESWSQSKPSTSANNMYSKEYVEPSKTLSNCLFADDMEGMDDLDIDIEFNSGDPLNVCQGFGDFLLPTEGVQQKWAPDSEMRSLSEDQQCSDKSMRATVKEEQSEDSAGVDESDSEISCPSKVTKPLPKSLFTVRRSEENSRPWVRRHNFKEEISVKCEPMSEFEEMELYYSLRQASSSPDFPPEAHRLYRKLAVRCLKRRRNMALFDLDSPNVTSRFRHQQVPSRKDVVRLLDRFQRVMPLRDFSAEQSSFTIRLMGQTEPAPFYSPYTQRVLKPYIRRDTTVSPLWLKLMNELLVKANKNSPSWKPPERWPIDYCYVRPHHIASVNNLCCEYFYPGVDLSECLTYPDFSCVALYKKLVIGFAFLVPDVAPNETYISFLFTRPLWRKAGIASFMLYHLIQTCMGKDVTLHVSVTNPALILYQKFGFKVEEFVQDFYDKYLPVDSTECKHALFLRLSR